jgi:hypothetical protein
VGRLDAACQFVNAMGGGFHSEWYGGLCGAEEPFVCLDCIQSKILVWGGLGVGLVGWNRDCGQCGGLEGGDVVERGAGDGGKTTVSMLLIGFSKSVRKGKDDHLRKCSISNARQTNVHPSLA